LVEPSKKLWAVEPVEPVELVELVQLVEPSKKLWAVELVELVELVQVEEAMELVDLMDLTIVCTQWECVWKHWEHLCLVWTPTSSAVNGFATLRMPLLTLEPVFDRRHRIQKMLKSRWLRY
jgi:hypothetical protein